MSISNDCNNHLRMPDKLYGEIQYIASELYKNDNYMMKYQAKIFLSNCSEVLFDVEPEILSN
jgi:hypothetical protein